MKDSGREFAVDEHTDSSDRISSAGRSTSLAKVEAETLVVIAYYPKCVSIVSLVKNHAKGKRREKLKDAIAYVLWLLTKTARKKSSDGWRPLSYSLLKGTVGQREWKQARHLLEEAGLIELDRRKYLGSKSRSDGSKCFRYRLTERARDDAFRVKKRTIRNPLLLRKIWQWRENRRENRHTGVFESSILETLAKNMTRLQIDRNSARRGIDKLVKDYEKKRLAGSKDAQLKVDQYSTLVRRTVNKIGTAQSSVDDFGWRLHHPLIRLPKHLRKYVTVDSERLTSIDISACQPALFGIVLRQIEEAMKMNRDDERRIETSAPDIPWFCRCLAANASEELKEFFSSNWRTQSTLSFFEKCERGSIYWAIAKSCKDRKRAKKKIIAEVLFGNTRRIDEVLHSQKTDVEAGDDRESSYGYYWKLFEDKYPEVAQAIRLMKMPCAFGKEPTTWFGDALMSQKPYRQLSMLLQRAESLFIRHHVLPIFWNDTRGAFALTIHDALVVHAVSAEQGKQAIIRAAEEIGLGWGMTVKDEIKNWTMSKQGGRRVKSG